MLVIVPNYDAACILDTDTGQPVATQKFHINRFLEYESEINSGHDVFHMDGDVSVSAQKYRSVAGEQIQFKRLDPYVYPFVDGPKVKTSMGRFNLIPGSLTAFDERYQSHYTWTFSLSGASMYYRSKASYGWWYRYVETVMVPTGRPGIYNAMWGQVTGTLRPEEGESFQPSKDSITNWYRHENVDLRVESRYQPDYQSLRDLPGCASFFMNALGFYFEDTVEGKIPEHSNYSYLCADACESIRYDHHNTLMNVRDLIRFKPDISDMYDSFLDFWKTATTRGNVGDGKRLGVLRQAASAYLGTLYGPRLTMAEMSDILLRERSNTSQGSLTSTRDFTVPVNTNLHAQGTARVSFKYTFGCANTFKAALGRMGISKPNLADAFDAIPYSFVVDWFLGVSDYLENSERSGFIEELPVSDIWYSEKSTITGERVYDVAIATCNVKFYYRKSKSALGSKLSGYRSIGSDPVWRDKVPQMGALLLQKL